MKNLLKILLVSLLLTYCISINNTNNDFKYDLMSFNPFNVSDNHNDINNEWDKHFDVETLFYITGE